MKPIIILYKVSHLLHIQNFFNQFFDLIILDSKPDKVSSLWKDVPIFVFDDDSVEELKDIEAKTMFPRSGFAFKSKVFTNSWLKALGLNVPDTELLVKIPRNFKAKEPCITKPENGVGRIGFRTWSQGEQINCPKGYIKQPWLQGKEFNLDVIKNEKGQIYVCAKEKLLIKAGATFKAKLVNIPELEKIGITIAENIDYIGSIDIDVIYYKNVFYIIDINPRIGGGFFHSITLDPTFLQLFLKCLGVEKEFDFEHGKESIIEYKYKKIL